MKRVESLGAVRGNVQQAEPMRQAELALVLMSSAALTSHVEGPAAERREAPPGGGLPCLGRNNCTNTPPIGVSQVSGIKGQPRKERWKQIGVGGREEHWFKPTGEVDVKWYKGDLKATVWTVYENGLGHRHIVKGTLPEGPWNEVAPGHARSAFVLRGEIKALVKNFDLSSLAMLTLTFAEDVQDIKEMQRRFHSLATHVLKARYARLIGVVERQASGRLHLHLIVVCPVNVREGFDFQALQRVYAAEKSGDKARVFSARKALYRTVCPYLLAEWRFWRKTAPKYGFGRHELTPIRTCVEAVARYVAKYLTKHVEARIEGDKGARLVRYLGFEGQRRCSCRFAWFSKGSMEWRRKLGLFGARFGCADLEVLREMFGPRWGWFYREVVFHIDALLAGEAEASDGVFRLVENSDLAFRRVRRRFEEAFACARRYWAGGMVPDVEPPALEMGGVEVPF